MLYVVGLLAFVVGFALGYGIRAEMSHRRQKRLNCYWFCDDKPLKVTRAEWKRMCDVLNTPRIKEG